MKAFGIESTDTMSIVDKFNEVGNRFAITSAGIGDALQRSASALFEGGNTLDEAIALITTANQVVQNPEVVGTAMKTLSLRLRSAKVDLESAGEDVDGMADSVSDLQKKLLALTGGKVDIMIDKDTFKSTTQILREMSNVWGEMTDANRSAALDLMGGKRQANTLAAIIKDFQTVEKVIETSSNSAGSALKENEVYLDSMQGRIDKLTNSIQSMWVNAMDSDILKFFISVADVFVQATDKAGLFNVAIGLLMAKIAFSGKKFGIVNLLSKISGGAIAASGSINILGVSLKAGTTAFKLFNAAATMGISLLAGLAIEGIIKLADELIVTSEEIKEAANQAQDAITSLTSKFKADAKTISDYAERFAELAQGVDMLSGKNISLTTDDYEEFLSLSNQLADIFPTLSRNYDENGNAIVQLSGDTDTMVGSLQALLDVQRQITNQKIAENLPDLYKGVKQQSDEYVDTLNDLEARRDTFINQLKEIQSKDFIDNINDGLESGILKIFDENASADALYDIRDAYAAVLDEIGLAYQELTPDYKTNKDTGLDEVVGYTFQIDYTGMTDEEIDAAKQKITTGISDLASTYSTEINNLGNEIAITVNENKANWSSLLSSIFSWLTTDESYQVLSDDMQTVVQSMVNNIDFSKLDNVDTWEKMQAYIQDNIISKIKSATPEVQDAFSQLFKIKTNNKTTAEYINAIKDQAQKIANSSDFTYDEILKNTGFEDIIDKYETSAQDILRVLDDNIPKYYEQYEAGTAAHFHSLEQYSVEVEALKDKIYSLSPDEVTRAFDIIKKYGIKTWDDLVKALESKTFDVVLNYDAEKSGIDNFLTAIEESVSATGLSAESIANLKSRYSEFIKEGYNIDTLFEETANGIHLNTQALNELEHAYTKQKTNDLNNKLEGLKEHYNKLTKEINDCSDSSKRVDLYAQRSNIMAQIRDTATLAAQYQGLTSAYQQWQNAQSAGNERDMYEGIISGKKELEEEMKRGWLDRGSIEYLELLSGKDLSTAKYDEILKIYQELNDTMNGGYNVFDFFTENDDGATTEGIFNFFDAVIAKQKELGKEWVKINEDGAYSFDFGVNGDKAIAEALNISEELVQIILRAAKDAGFDINLDSVYSGLADLRDMAQEANDKLKAIGATDYTFNVYSTNLEDINYQINKAQEALNTFKSSDGTINVKAEGCEEAQILLATLIRQRQSLETPAVLEVDTNSASTEVQNVMALVKDFKENYNTLEVQTAIGENTSDTQAKLNEITAKLQEADPKVLATLGIDPAKAQQDINTSINNINPEMLVDLIPDPTALAEYKTATENGENDIEAKVTWQNVSKEVDDWKSQNHDISPSVRWKNDVTGVKTTFTGQGYIKWNVFGEANGTAHALGTLPSRNSALANGNWGLPRTETALVGELGQELIVDPKNGTWHTVGDTGAEFTTIPKGSIVFNHKQTEQLLKNGYVTGRGKAYADGTSYGGNSLLDRIRRIIESIKLDRLAKYAEKMCEQYEELTNGNVELRKRPHLSPSYEHELAMSGGYYSFIGSDGKIYASTSAETMTVGKGKNQYTIDITPVLENGETLTSDSLAEYVNNLVTDGSMQDLLDSDKYNLIIRAVPGEYNEKDWSGFEDKLSEYKDGYLNTILDMFDLGGEKAVEAYGFSSVGLADVSRDLQSNGSYNGKEVASAIDDTSEGMRNLNELINQYVTDVLNAKFLADEIGTDLSKTQYGNVDTDTRQKLYWDEGSIDKYSDALDSWGMKAEEIIGTYSTLLSAQNNFNGVDIAFSPILQTEDGPQLLDSNTVHEYIWGLIDKASKDGGQWTSEELFQLDTEGLEFNGTVIKNLLEDIGESASATSKLLHYVGDTGAILNLEGEIEATASELVTTGENISDIQAKLDLLNATNISDKIFTVTEVYQTVGSGRSEGVHISGSGGRYTKYANGTVHVNGNAYSNGNFGAPKTETALVGELGPELLVRNGRWTTVGEDGAEFAQVKKGDIIFNHKQTEDLLSKGYVTGRGKAFANGTAYSSGAGPGRYTVGSAAIKSSGKSSSDKTKDEFEEIFDWIEVRLEEINKQLDFRNARLDNSVGFAKQNAVISEMLDLNEKLYDNLIAGANKYYEYAGQLLAKIPAEYRQAAQDGSIAIETFVGEVDEETYNAIQDFREWVQKGDDAVQQAEEVITEVSSLAKQAIDNIATDFGNKNSLRDSKIDQLDAYNALTETKYGAESEAIYKAIIKETNKNIKTLETQRDKMQAELDKQVREGNIQKYSQDWYDAVNDIAAVDTEIINLTKDTYDYQDSINDLHWDAFDNILSRLEAISDEADNLIDILGEKDLVNKDTAEWTNEGITALGLYAQKMEVAEMQAKKYKDEINYLNKNWKKLGYTEQEYVEKLEELKEGQYDAIKAYNDTKKAIVDLNKQRVEAIKNGIQKEIDAYEELINKKKEELDADKDIHGFQKSIADKQKNISDIQRKIAALSADDSASARAQRAKLQSELLEAQADLEEAYYDRSITDQQNALDKELENFKENKNKEIEGWDEYLENTNQVVSDSLSTVQTNTDVVYNTLKAMGKEYSLSIAESLTSPWKDGENAIQSFSEKFGLSMSSTVEELQKISDEFKKVMDEIDGYGQKVVDQVDDNASRYQEANNPEKPKFNPPETVVKPVTPSGGGASSSQPSQPSHAGAVSGISAWLKQGSQGADVRTLQQALNDLGFNAGAVDGIFGYNTKQAVMRFQSSSSYGGAISADGIVGPDTKRKFRTAGYAKGTTGVKKNQLALIDELGEELRLVPDGNGRLAYLKKGTAIIPHDISENLMQLGQLNPQDILDRNRPTINAPHITNNETVISIEYGDVLHIENFNGDKPEDLRKMVDNAFNKHMKQLNAEIRKYTR